MRAVAVIVFRPVPFAGPGFLILQALFF